MTVETFAISPIITVGITGHRTLAAPDQVRARIADVFGAIKGSVGGAQASDEPVIRLISPLAEGADRIFAEVGLAAGAGLHCPLPFAREEYANDFESPASKLEFHGLLAKAQSVLELDGDPNRRDQAYLEVGRVVVSHSDILVAVWDRQPGRGVGGTADIVAEALRDGVVVVWVDPTGARPPGLLEGHPLTSAPHPLSALDGKLKPIVEAPLAHSSEGAPAVGYQTFIGEKPPRFSLGSAFDLFVKLLQPSRWKIPRFQKRRRYEASESDWLSPYAEHAAIRSVCAPCLDGEAAAAFARADTLANQYAGFYRSTFLFTFVLSALAVAVALMGGEPRRGWNIAAELVIICTIVCLILLANHRNWHERWIEYRHLAEQLRPLRFLFPLGLTLPKAHIGKAVEGNEHQSEWVDWLSHRMQRTLGLPNVAIDSRYLAAVRDFAVDAVLEEQIDYHRKNALKLKHVDEVLQAGGLMLFGLTAFLCLVGFVIAPDMQPWIKASFGLDTGSRQTGFWHAVAGLIPTLAGLIPAFGAAILGIRNVGEFARLQKRSTAMKSALERLKHGLAGDEVADLGRSRLGPQLQAMAAQLMSETADWRTLVIARRLELPI